MNRVLLALLVVVLGQAIDSASLAAAQPLGSSQPLVDGPLVDGPADAYVQSLLSVARPLWPAPLDPISVADYFGYFPNRYIARQPVGHDIIPTGPNGYVYRPVYADEESDLTGPPPADAPAARHEVNPWANGRLRDRPRANRPAPPPADVVFGRAVESFRAARYADALDDLEQVLTVNPDDAMARLLSAQALFALSDYEAAADSLRRAIAELDKEDWGRFVVDYRDYYPSNLEYLVHLRTLERYVQDGPDDPDARLLLAYHYGYLGFPVEAIIQFDMLPGLVRRDEAARQLRDHFSRLVDDAPRPADDPAPAPADVQRIRPRRQPREF